jgi:hypothetical protein
MPRFELRIPISPTPSFYSNVRLASLSLARLGEPYSSAPIVVSVGDHADAHNVRMANRWSESFPVIWSVVPATVCDQEGFVWAVHRAKFESEPREDIVLLCDADLCVTARFDELLEALQDERPRIAGLVAHASPFGDRSPAGNDAEWRRIFDAFELSNIPLSCEYSKVPREQGGSCPAYFNNGFVACNRKAFEEIQSLVHARTVRLFSLLKEGPFFAAQVGLAVAIAEKGIDTVLLGPAYNCPNSDEMFGHGLGDVSEIRVVHYLRGEEFDRRQFLCDPAAYAEFKGKRFKSRVNEYFQQHVLSLPDIFYSSQVDRA